MSRIAVVGGGVAGIATAGLLARDGHEVELFEQFDELGGRAGQWRSQGFAFDTGPSWMLMREPYEHVFRLLGSSLAEELEVVRLDPAYRVIFEDDRVGLEVSGDLDTTIERFEALEPGAGELLRTYLRSAGEAARMATSGLLSNRFDRLSSFAGHGLLTRLPTLSRLLVESLDSRIRRSFGDPRIRQVLGYPAVFLGAEPRRAPSMYHLMSHFDLVEGVWYPMGGFAAVVDALVGLARQNGVRIRTGSPVRRILVEQRKAVGVELAEGSRIEADIVVSAIDAYATDTRLLSHVPKVPVRAERRWRKRVAGPSAVLVMLGVRGEVPQLTHHTLLFAREWEEGFDRIFGPLGPDPLDGVTDPASMYVSRTSATDSSVAPDGDEALFILIPVAADARLDSDAAEVVADRAIEQLSTWAAIPGLASRIVTRRVIAPADFSRNFGSWRASALGPAHTLRQSAMLRGRTAHPLVRGLFMAGATTVPGIGVPMCLISAELVVKHVRGDHSTGPLAEQLS